MTDNNLGLCVIPVTYHIVIVSNRVGVQESAEEKK